MAPVIGARVIGARFLITGARAPVAMHLSRHLIQAGHQVWLADTPRYPVSCGTAHKSGYLRLPPPRHDLAAYGQAVAGAVRHYGIDLIIPTCEEVFYLAALRDVISGDVLGLDLPLFAPPLSVLRDVHDKGAFAEMTQALPVIAPQTYRLQSAADMKAAIQRPGEWVYKPVWSRFGEQVLIRPTAEQVLRLKPTPAQPWVQQAFLPGEELCCYAIAHQGRIVAYKAYRPLWRAGSGATGAGVFVEPVEDAAITAFVQAFAKRLNWHGQVSFDFRRDADGRLYVIECNPRATTGGLFFRPEDDLAGAIADGVPAAASGAKPLSIALAMTVFALPDAIRTKRLGDWRADMKRFDSMLDWPGDKGLAGAQVLAFLETIWTALRGRQSLKAAATADIEWNGEAFDLIANPAASG